MSRLSKWIDSKQPTVLYPTLVRGYINGPIRCESLDGTEMWLPPREGLLTIPPFERYAKEDGKEVKKMFCVSHLQKKATYFSLLYEPFIYHWCKAWKLQQQDASGNWIPGSERLLYWRTPGWRWQVPDAVSNWTPWIFSGGRILGGHLD